jgi:hypothetical protein
VHGIYKIVVSKHEDEIVYGNIIYHTARPNGTAPIEAKIETLPGTDEENVLKDCIAWIEKNLPGEMEVMKSLGV